MWWKVSNVWNFEFLNYVIFTFFGKPLQKNVKSRVFLDFQKNVKNVFSNYAFGFWKCCFDTSQQFTFEDTTLTNFDKLAISADSLDTFCN